MATQSRHLFNSSPNLRRPPRGDNRWQRSSRASRHLPVIQATRHAVGNIPTRKMPAIEDVRQISRMSNLKRDRGRDHQASSLHSWRFGFHGDGECMSAAERWITCLTRLHTQGAETIHQNQSQIHAARLRQTLGALGCAPLHAFGLWPV